MFKNRFSSGRDTKDYSIFILAHEDALAHKLIKIVQGAGYQVQSTTSGQLAIALLDKPPLPDMFILDLLIPDIDIPQFLETIRQRFGRNTLPPVLLLADSKEGEATANLLQVQDYMQQPFEGEELLTHIWQLLEKKTSS